MGNDFTEKCMVCGCALHRSGDYARPTVKGRSHATQHHLVPERFFGRSKNRRGETREPIFNKCPWGLEGEKAIFCYDCHEELLHNPVFTKDNLALYSRIVFARGLNEDIKTNSREKLAERIKLLHEAIEIGLKQLDKETNNMVE